MDRRSLLGLSAAAAASLAVSARAADPLQPGWVPSSDRLPGDPTETIPLWPHIPPGGAKVHLKLQLIERSPTPGIFHDRFVTDIQTPLLTVFRPDKPSGAALLIVPGGGYRRVVIDKEGFEAARRLNGSGITCFVLRYRLPAEGWDGGPGAPFQDAQRAMRLIRARAADFAIDPKRVGVLGFSAGGHVAASLMVHATELTLGYRWADKIDNFDAHPDFAGLMYPVISMALPIAHFGSREKLLGRDPNPTMEIAQSPNLFVPIAAATGNLPPPTFIALAADDKEVDPANSYEMLVALRKAGVKTEFHMFEEGGHGFGLRLIQGKPAAIWPDLFVNWARRHGWV